MNELTAFILLVFAAVVVILPRQYIVATIVMAACFVPTDQRFIIADLDLTLLRILLGVAVLRLMAKSELVRVQWTGFDMLVLAWALCGAVVYSLQWLTQKAVLNRCGVLVDVLGMYWLFRQTIRSWADIRLAAVAFAVAAIALVPLVAWEWMTRSDPFNAIGHITPLFRGQDYRCSAAFPHSIMLGVFWAAIVPLFLSFIMIGRDRILFWLAIASAVFIVSATASSTPLVTLFIGVGAMVCYKWRRFAPTLALVAIGLLVALHFAMKAPVWHLLARINVVQGSTGWYRFYLIDRAIAHFGEWASMGCRDTESWGRGLGDLTNQYVLEGVRGGVVTLALFVGMLAAGASRLLKISLHEPHTQKQLVICAVLAMLLTHCAAFGGVSYFGQIAVEWQIVLAMIGLLCEWQTAGIRREFPSQVLNRPEVAA
jgi:hypothetical protein